MPQRTFVDIEVPQACLPKNHLSDRHCRLTVDNLDCVILLIKFVALQRDAFIVKRIFAWYRVAVSLPECERTSCRFGRSDVLFDVVDTYVLFDPDPDRGGDGASATCGSSDVGEWAGDVASPKLVFVAVAAVGSQQQVGGVGAAGEVALMA